MNSFGDVEQFDSPDEVYLLNAGTMEYDNDNDVLYFLFIGRPIFQKYNGQGELLISKVIEGEEVRRGYEAYSLGTQQKKSPSRYYWVDGLLL